MNSSEVGISSTKVENETKLDEQKNGDINQQHKSPLTSSMAEDTLDYRIDEWPIYVERFFEFLHVPLCYLIKMSMVVLTISTTCVYFAVCLIASLKFLA